MTVLMLGTLNVRSLELLLDPAALEPFSGIVKTVHVQIASTPVRIIMARLSTQVVSIIHPAVFAAVI